MTKGSCTRANGKSETNFVKIFFFRDRLASNSNIKDGVGVMFWPDGTKYEGDFLNNYP